jgi:peptidoglycan/xylan/chitin deacetylase (PgdA/CDA1 family)
MRKITLTFDNGPAPDITPHILDCLAAHSIRSTFFVLGQNISDPARAVFARRALDEGHSVGNHTFSHRTPLGELSREAALDEFDRTEAALDLLGTRSPRLFRPYGGRGAVGPHLLHPAVVERLESGGYTCVLWNVVPGDFRYPDDWPQRGLDTCRTLDWSLVVLHDIYPTTLAHLDSFIRQLKDEGFGFTQDYPPECTPIVDGRIVLPLEPYVQGLSGIRR